MQVAPYEGIEVFNDSDPEAISSRQHEKLYPAAWSGEPLSPPGKRICGLSRVVFWLVVAITVVIISMIGLGAGLGVALSKAQNATVDSGEPSSFGSPGSAASLSTSSTQTALTTSMSTTSSTRTTSSTSTTSSTTSTSTGAPKPSNICPGANNNILTAPIGDVRYRVACDSDFSGDGKQTLASFFAATWDDCLALCNTMNYFQSRADVGCTWNVAGTGGQTPGTCWCLGGADKTVVVNRGNVVAVPQ